MTDVTNERWYQHSMILTLKGELAAMTARAEAAEKALRDPILVETAARAICKRRGIDPDMCVFGHGSAGPASSQFECYRYAWQDYVGDVHAVLEVKP